MNTIVRYMQGCLGLDQDAKYALLHKKDDDISQDLIERWIDLSSAESVLKDLDPQSIQERVATIFQELKKININSSNVHSIASHLYGLAKQSKKVQDACLIQVGKLSCHFQEKEIIQRKLSYLVADQP